MDNILKAPSLDQITKVANLLDSMGEFEDAEILDEYIEAVAYLGDGEIIKQAGLWGNIWKRLKGSVKKMFISEYRDLYEEARRSQERLEDRIDKIKEESKNIKLSFKNYDFGEWRTNIAKLQVQGLYTADIMQGFESKYAKFVNYVTEHFKEDSDVSPELMAKMENMPTNEREERAVENIFKGWDKKQTSWVKSDGKNKSIQSYIEDPNRIRIMQKYYDEWVMIERQHIVGVGGEPNTISFNFKSKLKTPPNLREVFGNYKWKVLGSDGEYTYLEKAGQLTGTEVAEEPPPVEKVNEQDIPKDIAPVPPQKEDSSEKPGGLGVPEHTVVPPKPVEKPKSEVEKMMEEIEGTKPISVREKKEPSAPVDLTKIISTEPVKKPEENIPLGEVVVPGEQKPLTEVIPSTPQVEKSIPVPEEKAELVGEIEQKKEVEQAKEMSKKEKFPITGKPEGTMWVRYKSNGKYAPIKMENFRHPVHVEVTNPQLIAKLDSKWAQRENNERKIEMKEAFSNRKNRIISISQQKDMSPIKQRVLDLLSK